MSTSKATRHTVHCDTCGAKHETEEPTAYGARIAAGITGWKYAVGRLPGPGTKGQREWDYCPTCWPNSPHAKGEA